MFLKLMNIPQKIYLFDDSIKRNITLGQEDEEINFDKLDEIIKSIHLDKMIADLGVKQNDNENSETVIERLFPNELDRLELAYNFAKRIVLVRTTPEINPKNAISMLPPTPRGVTYKKPQGKQQ